MAPHRDRYAHLAPQRPRECHTEAGVPKVRYVESRARAAAAKFEGYHAYECSHCGWWHVGSDRRDT